MEHITTKTDCSFIRNNLFAYQEKQLPESKFREFEDHLHTCKECTRIVSDFLSVTSFIDIKKSDEPNPFIHTRTLQRIESQLRRERSASNSVTEKILRPISVSFLLLAAVIIGFSIVKPWETRFSDNIDHQNDIQVMKSELNIPDFIDEDNIFFDNY